MNTRIQVEHPVTELVYGVDLVREQLRIAGGRGMSVRQESLAPRGWAIECRITSEDPSNGLLPSAGTITWLRVPSGPGVRWDAGITAGDTVTLFYDSMLAKLICHGPTRTDAIETMRRALHELLVVGVATNVPFHLALLEDPDFRAGKVDIQFLERRADLLEPTLDRALLTRLAVTAALLEERRRTARRTTAASTESEHNPAWRAAARRDALQ
jgi:acetyl-CoA carboxylase biotin carboxylase subunit